ncbi:hypothetical protein Enr13x_65390 [Stieleria neptunia]|uniref:Uncharacterized protein n=1 Tax=Stieleria neptunia TaxID=2527979 RepID=A0A518I0J5_9BACT|nr:hypothetical protein [Stieleria neptunia]QDV46630.1 hypothetical protein Enr13x_65390 [Stieleria neptunia]
MSTGRLPLRTLTTTIAVSLASLCGADACQAGCLDWLFGRSATYTANYPYAYPVAGTPVAGTPVAGTPVVGTQVSTAPITPAPFRSGVVQAQRPAYNAPLTAVSAMTTVQSFDNPSVYTGMPVNSTPQYGSPQYSAQRLPITRYAPTTTIAPQTTNAYRLPIVSGQTYTQPYTTANRVPISSTLRGTAGVNPITPTPVYTSNYPTGVAPVTYNAAPATYAPLVPVGPQPPRRFGSGLARFFNSLLGRNTNYTTSYYRAPITYYRPATMVDPTTGTTVTVQQPCSSYVQQLQRVPYNSSLPLQPGTTTLQTSPGACSTPMLGNTSPSSSFPLAGTPGSFAPPSSGIGQVGGQFAPGAPGITTIPSTMPDAGYPNAAPLTGGASGNATGNADDDPVGRPELESGRPPLNGSSNAAPSDNGYLDDSYDTDGYGDDLYPYGNTPSDPGQSDGDAADDPNRPAIQLDPPVTRQMRTPDPSGRFSHSEQFTTRTPPSMAKPLSPPASDSESGESQLSTLRPIGVPSGPPTMTGPMSLTNPQAGTAPSREPAPTRRVVQPPSTQPFQAPPLPAPSARGADPSALFRNTESSASSRSTTRPRVSVPVREATTRHQNVRQVAAWDDTAWEETTPAITTTPATPRRPAPVQRDSGGWLPAR